MLKKVNQSVRIDALLSGVLVPLGPKKVPSAIAKTPAHNAIFLGKEGLATDRQGDRKHHGGPDKAIHHYSIDHYQKWLEEIGERDVMTRPGAFGENFSSTGLDETQVAIGDVFSVGGAIVQVSQGRQPCWKLNLRFDVPNMAQRVQQCGRTGWYYRVLQQGLVEAGDELVPLDRSSPEWTIDRVRRLFYLDPLNFDGLAALAALPHLAEEWRNYARQRMETRQVEDWAPRLNQR